MDFLKSRFDRIHQQFSALSATQKMLSVALVAIMVMTLFWWGRYAGVPEMEPLLSQPLSEAEVGRIKVQLDSHGVKHEVTADHKILVPSDRRIEIISVLTYADLMPRNTTNGFDSIIKNLTPWDGQDRQNAMFNRGKEMTLSDVIRHFPGVADATVAIDPTRERRIGGNVEPRGFVNIQMKAGGAATPKLVSAAARAVMGAQADLQLKNVQVVVDGAPHHVREADPAGEAAETVYEMRLKEEARLADRLRAHLADIPGVMIAVTVAVNGTSQEKVEKKVTGVISKESQTSSMSREQSGGTTPPAEPGATPNVGANGAVAISAGQTMSSQTETEEKTTLQHFPSQEEIHSTTLAGATTAIGASIRVPRSHFERIARGRGAAPADDKIVEATIDKESARLRGIVVRAAGMKSEADVVIDPYWDVPVDPPPVMAGAGGAGIGFSIARNLKEIVLGALALISVFLVLNIVRKGAPAPLAEAARTSVAPRAGASVLDAGEDLAGEAGEGDPALDGMELDEEAVRTQQMLKQVGGMVDDNPEAAAALVKRWLNRN